MVNLRQIFNLKRQKNESSQVKFYIYYHNDFDGIASAAIFARFLHLKDNLKFDNFYFHSVDYNLKKKWVDYPLNHPCCVIDFLYHHESDWWFDHHESTFSTRASTIRPYEASSKKYWNSNFLSCPSLLIQHFKKYFKDYSVILKKRYTDLVKWSDIIDGAKYPSPSEVYRYDNDYFNISKTLARNENKKYFKIIIKAFYYKDLNMIVKMDDYQNLLVKYRAIEKEAVETLSNQIVIENNTAFFDQSDYDFPFQRYLPYYLYPEINYRIAIYKRNKKYVVSVNYNVWKKEKNNINLGNVCYTLGGGGHNDVGAVMTNNHHDAQKIAKIIIYRLKNSITEQMKFSNIK